MTPLRHGLLGARAIVVAGGVGEVVRAPGDYFSGSRLELGAVGDAARRPGPGLIRPS